jgi:predicted AlkP superfamily phosphohydrolase/phosphomutase
MLTGQNPGKFGFWSFTFRNSYSYEENQLVSSYKIKSKAIYHILTQHGKRVALVNIPVTYPAIKLKNGFCVSSFLAPDESSDFIHPCGMKKELIQKHGPYLFDASEDGINFRALPKEQVRDKIYKMDSQKLAITRDLIQSRNYDLIFTVLMGTDRMAHLFFHYADENHPRFEKNPEFQNSLKEHYQFCDREIGRVLKLLPPDTTLLLVSDHGTQALKGRFNTNEWLLANGYLALKSPKPDKPTALKHLDVDWEKTIAWTTGFTEGRLYLNLKGREKHGVVDPKNYSQTLDKLAGELAGLKTKDGQALPVKAIKRDQVYTGPYACYAPDLFLEFDRNRWANNALLGYPSLYSYHTPKGSDFGVHSPYGIFAALPAAGARKPGQELKNISNYDIAPTILDLLGVKAEQEMDGRAIHF